MGAAAQQRRLAMAGSQLDRTNNRRAGPSSWRHESNAQHVMVAPVDSTMVRKNQHLRDGDAAWWTGTEVERMTDHRDTEIYDPSGHEHSLEEQYRMSARCQTCLRSRDTRRAYFPQGLLHQTCRAQYRWSFWTDRAFPMAHRSPCCGYQIPGICSRRHGCASDPGRYGFFPAARFPSLGYRRYESPDVYGPTAARHHTCCGEVRNGGRGAQGGERHG